MNSPEIPCLRVLLTIGAGAGLEYGLLNTVKRTLTYVSLQKSLYG